MSAPARSRNTDYIGLTTATLEKRMENHRYNGAIHTHFKKAHDRRPTSQELLDCSSILHRVQKFHRLAITEAVSIELRKPVLNIQREFDLVLPSCRKRERDNNNTTQNNPLPPAENPPATAAPPPALPPPNTEPGGSGENEDRRVEPQPPSATEYVRQRVRPRVRP